MWSIHLRMQVHSEHVGGVTVEAPALTRKQFRANKLRNSYTRKIISMCMYRRVNKTPLNRGTVAIPLLRLS